MRIGEDYRRRYWPFVLWVLLLPAGIGLIAYWAEPLLPEDDLGKLALAFVTLALDLLMFLIWRLETVYWFNNGPDFEAARDGGSQRRRRYAWLHLKRFLMVTAPVLLYLALSAALGWPLWLDALLFCIAVVAAAVSTVHIHF